MARALEASESSCAKNYETGNQAFSIRLGFLTTRSRIGLRLALGERRSLTLRRPSREIEFVLQPVALLPQFLFFLLDEFLFMPKLFVLSTQLLIFVFELFDSMTSGYAEQYYPALHNPNQGICPAPPLINYKNADSG